MMLHTKYSQTYMARTCRTVGASSTHGWVRAIPGLTIFKGFHMYLMLTMDAMFLSIKVAYCMFHLSFMSMYPFAR